ncbi:Cell division protein FtsQ [Rubrobacter xylanophilus DSM 9941]|uniref:cell division protein FtsQ/DivIB n=1 Tax=Rubrobacter xylanophilus TaxID=49319 RepID=UPI001C64333B|nr:FtsQ-type POTRA domain-containing protein [Rubrobacter xylanophilus]QYJ14726.1 Cell division protein FtsQ [Rubrobacter xylanophilus DSM 9941]
MISATAALLTFLLLHLITRFVVPVSGVEVSGARVYPENIAKEAVPEGESLLTLNTRAVERRVESNPWVKSARVRKDWRSGIVAIEVEERRPVLKAEVEGRRVVLALDGTELPGTGGRSLRLVELDKDRVRDVLEAARTLEDGGLRFESVREAGPGGFAAEVEGRPVVFGERVSLEQARALGEIMRRHPEAPYFDLRSPGRVVVGAPGADVGV